MHASRRRTAALLIAALSLVACGPAEPSDSASQPPPASTGGAETPAATATPTVTPQPTPETVGVPFAVVTGYTNLKSDITADEVSALADDDTIIRTCEIVQAVDTPKPLCLPAAEIVEHLQEAPTDIAFLPAGLVVPTIKVLPVDGADLFGGPAARALPYPYVTDVNDPPVDWLLDTNDIRTLMSLGDSCPDRAVAYQAITLGKGWEYVFGGGTAAYDAVYPNPVPPGVFGNGYNIVDAHATDNAGAVAALVSGADVTLDDFECPVIDNFTVNDGVVFSIDPRVLPHLRDDYGVDVATLAANHLFDRGTSGFLETLQHFEDVGIPTAGAGTDLDNALAPAVVEVNGLRFGFVGFNEVPGSQEAAAGVPGVAWLTDGNVSAAVDGARAVADVVICVPQWWGGAEYHAEFRGDMRRQEAYFFEAGCDQVVGHGTHWSGPIDFTTDDRGIHVTMVSHGNFLFGQSWSQQTQEGVTLELAFHGTDLVQARMHPYVMLEQAQTNLTDPETDGSYVLNRIFEASGLR